MSYWAWCSENEGCSLQTPTDQTVVPKENSRTKSWSIRSSGNGQMKGWGWIHHHRPSLVWFQLGQPFHPWSEAKQLWSIYVRNFWIKRLSSAQWNPGQRSHRVSTRAIRVRCCVSQGRMSLILRLGWLDTRCDLVFATLHRVVRAFTFIYASCNRSHRVTTLYGKPQRQLAKVEVELPNCPILCLYTFVKIPVYSNIHSHSTIKQIIRVPSGTNFSSSSSPLSSHLI